MRAAKLVHVFRKAVGKRHDDQGKSWSWNRRPSPYYDQHHGFAVALKVLPAPSTFASAFHFATVKLTSMLKSFFNSC